MLRLAPDGGACLTQSGGFTDVLQEIPLTKRAGFLVATWVPVKHPSLSIALFCLSVAPSLVVCRTLISKGPWERAGQQQQQAGILSGPVWTAAHHALFYVSDGQLQAWTRLHSSAGMSLHLVKLSHCQRHGTKLETSMTLIFKSRQFL